MKKNIIVCLITVLALLSLALCVTAEAQSASEGNMRVIFEKKYEAWKEYRKQQPPSPSSFRTIDMESQPYREIIQLGIPALPYMMEKIKNDARGGGRSLVSAILIITKKKFQITRTGQRPKEFRWTVEEFPDMKDLTNPPRRYKLWLRWWKEGATCTSEQFEKFYQEWKKLKQEGEKTEAEVKYRRMIDLGVASLPCMTKKIEQGDAELVPAISELTDNKVKKDAKQSEYLNWWKENKEKWLIPFPEVESQTTAKN